MARKLCLQSLSHFLQSSLYFFLPCASRKNAHSLLRYLGIRGMADTSFLLVFSWEVWKRITPASTVWFWGDFGLFRWIGAAFPWRRCILPSGFQNRGLLRLAIKKAPYCYDASCTSNVALACKVVTVVNLLFLYWTVVPSKSLPTISEVCSFPS